MADTTMLLMKMYSLKVGKAGDACTTMADTTMLLMEMYSLKVGKVGDACTMMADTTMLLRATFLLAGCQLPLTRVVWHGDTQDKILIRGIRIK